MAVRSVDPSDQNVRDIYSAPRRRARGRRRPQRYRLAVVAPSAADVIRHVGGWLFDRTYAGWEVIVLVSDSSNARPLGILGATVLDLETSLATPVHGVWPNAVAVDARTYLADGRVRDGVHECLDRGLAEVSLWGDGLPGELNSRIEPVEHRVSVAGRAFKACALDAAGLPDEQVQVTEAFRTAELMSDCRRSGDLLSARPVAGV
ncbi:hypothetical protein BJY24_004510 [Nocardia transvalensis]|uniref:Uncharacterized protein n=1 Tax=Nocardia transvalensis TaxID=37333 RepID=A0A7W9PH59_9NOCA|nr:hypothetical protein [Nocardia transvalensis]MBB5915598.1 hypothetical protein [Nocardia transvalensis]